MNPLPHPLSPVSHKNAPPSLLDLPPELLHLILSEIEDRSTLFQLVEASKRFNALMTAHLPFRQMRMPPSPINASIWAHLAKYGSHTRNVRSLEQSDPGEEILSLEGTKSTMVEAMQHMCKLKALIWETAIDVPPGLFRVVRHSCVDLQDLRMSFSCSSEHVMSKIYTELRPILSLSNLVVFSFQSNAPRFNSNIASVANSFTLNLAKMLQQRCPNLRALAFRSRDIGEGLFDNGILGCTWPELREIHLWIRGASQTQEAAEFLERHRTLEHIRVEGPRTPSMGSECCGGFVDCERLCADEEEHESRRALPIRSSHTPESTMRDARRRSVDPDAQVEMSIDAARRHPLDMRAYQYPPSPV